MMTGSDKDSVDHDKDKVYSNMIMSEMMNTMISDVKNNNLKSFKKYIDDNKDEISTYASDIRYSYNVDINIYDTDTSDGVTQAKSKHYYEYDLRYEHFTGQHECDVYQCRCMEPAAGQSGFTGFPV